MSIPHDYAERVYAGVLGKIIGVYLGRPVEGWTYERIMEELGDVEYYVHEQLDKPLIVPDDDISGTFTFLRALPDYGNNPDITPEQIGQTWLNYIIENRTILWWGGMGNSTEHTAYLRLKKGIPAPRSGSVALNGKVVAEQIGAQVFIDGWGMVAPGDPVLAAGLARCAGSVSHDGEAIYGAQVVAAMEALAFVTSDVNELIGTAVSLIPRDSNIYRMISDIRAWHARIKDWREARALLATEYGYNRYGGNCHVIPNHGLIVLGLLYGEGNFQQSLKIVNTSGWDTDCNSGNLGCLLGIRNGLKGLESGPDWRGPVADRMYISNADGGGAITDAVREAIRVVNIGRALAGLETMVLKGGARFHFDLPGSVQGFQPDITADSKGTVTVGNVDGHSVSGKRVLALHYHHLAQGRAARVGTPTFIPPTAGKQEGYGLVASPTLYSGQTVQARLEADSRNQGSVTAALYVAVYGAADRWEKVLGPQVELGPGQTDVIAWQLPSTDGSPIAEVGIELTSVQRADGTVYLDYLTWEGVPELVLKRPAHGGTMWRRAWVNGVDQTDSRPEAYRLIQNEGVGLYIQGTREWQDYTVTSAITLHMVEEAGIGARVQGMCRYYGLLLSRTGQVQLVKALDGQRILGAKPFLWQFGQTYELSLRVIGTRLQGWVDGEQLFDLHDTDRPLLDGAIALICNEGRMATEAVEIRPARP